MKPRTILFLLLWLTQIQVFCLGGITHEYLFIGHPRSDGAGQRFQRVQREVERIDFASFDMLLLGGDYTLETWAEEGTIPYLNDIFNLSALTTLTALGNHDQRSREDFSNVTGRPTSYSQEANGITFVVLDTIDDNHNILGDELQMLTDTIAAMPANNHLVIICHHFIWLTDNAINCPEYGSNEFIGQSSAWLSGLNFYSDVYPLLLQARAKGGEVICLAGDRTGSLTEEYYIDHTTADGIRFVGAGLKDVLTPSLRTVVVLEQDVDAGTLTCNFKHLTDLPTIPDEPLVISELHYNPSAEQGDDTAFIELFNRGSEPYDLSGATFSSGIVYTFPADTMIAPGEYILVAADPVYYTGLGVRVFGWEGSAIPTANAPIWLWGSRGLEIDYVEYGTDTEWPSLPNNQGPSLMLINSNLDNNLVTGWATSDQLGGTPGRLNIVPPVLGMISVGAGTATTQWNGVVSDGWYRLDYSPTLSPPDWKPVEPAIQATSTSIQLTDPNTMNAPQRFFRLVREFP